MTSKSKSSGGNKPQSLNNVSLLNATLQMSWKLAIVVLIPLIGGVKLDQHLNTFPYLTIAGSLLAIGGVCYVLMRVLAEFNQDTSSKGSTNV